MELRFEIFQTSRRLKTVYSWRLKYRDYDWENWSIIATAHDFHATIGQCEKEIENVRKSIIAKGPYHVTLPS